MAWELDEEHVQFRRTCRAFTDREVRPLVEHAEAEGRSRPSCGRRAPPACWACASPRSTAARRRRAGRRASSPRSWAGPSGGIAVTPLVSALHGRPAHRPVRHDGAEGALAAARSPRARRSPPSRSPSPAPAPTWPASATTGDRADEGWVRSRHEDVHHQRRPGRRASSSPPRPTRRPGTRASRRSSSSRRRGPDDGPRRCEDGLALLRHPRGGLRRRASCPRTRVARRRGPRLPPDHGGLPARADRAGGHGRRAGRRSASTTTLDVRRRARRRSARRSRACRRSGTGSPRWRSSCEAARLVTYQAAARLRHRPPRARGRRWRMAKYLAAGRRQPDRRRGRAALRRRTGSSRRRRWPGTTATPASCASAAAPTRSSWRSSPRGWPDDRDPHGRGRPRGARPGRGGRRSRALARQAAGARPARRCCSTPAPSWRTGCWRARRATALPADGVVTGVGRVDGRPVAVIAHDFTVKAGSWGELTVREAGPHPGARRPRPAAGLVPGRLRRRAAHRPARLLPGPPRRVGDLPPAGAAVGTGAADLLPARPVGGGRRVHARVLRLGRRWSTGNASMYLASPRVAEKVTGERTTLEEMGGALMHATVSGCGDEVFDSDWRGDRRGPAPVVLPARRLPLVRPRAATPSRRSG